MKNITTVWILSYLVFALGLAGMGAYYLAVTIYSAPQNMGIILGNSAIVLLGLCMTAIYPVLNHLDRRISKLEDANKSQPR